MTFTEEQRKEIGELVLISTRPSPPVYPRGGPSRFDEMRETLISKYGYDTYREMWRAAVLLAIYERMP